MDVTHTPTPWFASSQPDGRFDILDGPNLNTATVLCTRFEYSERKDEMHANAAFIVRACNAHDKLVEALLTSERFLTSRSYDARQLAEAIAEIRAALAAAGEPT
ncbi:MAG: hypothetical protein ACXU89_09380 [Xanthobacteraceae bacterium]